MTGLQQGTQRVNERSSSRVIFSFLDAARVLATPTSARYRIDDVTNGRKLEVLTWTNLVSPTSKTTVVITAEQNRILTASNNVEQRVVTVEAQGTDSTKNRQTLTYEIDSLPPTD